MVKSEFINLLSEKADSLNYREVDLITNFMFRTLVNSLTQGDRVEIRGFGSMTLKKLNPRQAVNPQTGEKIWTNGRYKIHYKPSKNIREKLNPETQGSEQ